MGIVITEKASQLPSDFFKKSHRLIFSQLSMSPVEQDLFGLFLCKLAKDDWKEFVDVSSSNLEKLIDDILSNERVTVANVPKYSFTNQVLHDWFGVEKRKLYELLKKPSARLASRGVGVQDDTTKKFKHNPLFSDISYENGILTMIPNHVLLKEFLCLSKGHAQIPHRQFRQLKGEYSKRIFTMLCRFKREQDRFHPVKIDELHAYLGLLDKDGKLTKKTYEKVNNIIERIIKPAIKEIDAVVPELVFFENDKDETRKGFCTVIENRKVVAIEFLFDWKPKTQKQELPKPSTAEIENKAELAVLTYQRLSKDEDLDLVTENDLLALKDEWGALMLDGFDMMSITAKFRIMLLDKS